MSIQGEYFFGGDVVLDYAYPRSYVEFVNSQAFDSISPWWLIGSSEGLFSISYRLLNQGLESDKKLIPFAKSEETGALAFFDLDGKVYLYEGDRSFKGLDWNKRFHMNSFDDWLNKVRSSDI